MWTYYISTDKDFLPSNVIDISSVCNMSQTSMVFARCTTAFKSVTTSLSFVIRNGNSTVFNQAISYILTAQNNGNDVHVRIVDGNSILFRGKLTTDTFSLTSKKISGDVTLKAKDYTTQLDKKEGYNENYENTTINNLVKYLLKDAGFGYAKASSPFDSSKQYYTYNTTEDTYTLVSSPQESQLSSYYEWSTPIYSTALSDTKIKEYYLISEDEGKTYRQKIDTLLLEAAGYVLHYRHSDGKFEIIQSIITDTTQARALNYKVSDGLATSSKPYEYDGVQVTWDSMTEKANCNIYAEDVGLEYDTEEGEWKGTTVAKMIGSQHAYFPDTGYTENIYQTFRIADRNYELKISGTQNEDLEFYYAKPSTCELEVKTVGGTPNKNGSTWETYESGDVKINPNPEFYPTKMQFLLWNKSSSEDLDLQQLSVKGNAIYRTKINKIVVPKKLINPDKYESKIFNKTDADAFAKWYYNARKFGGNTTTWTEVEGSNVMSQLGDVVTVTHTGVSMGQYYSVIQIENQCLVGTKRQYKITAVAVSAWDVTVDSYSSGTGTGAIVTETKVVDYGISDSQSTQPTTWSTSYTYTAGKWLWTRTTTALSTGEIVYSYTQTYMQETSDLSIQYGITITSELGVGESSFFGIGSDSIFTVNSQDQELDNVSITRDDRKPGSENLTFTAVIKNVSWTTIRWYLDDGVTPVKEGSNGDVKYILTSTYKGATAHKITYILDNDSTKTFTVSIPVVDKTTEVKFLGVRKGTKDAEGEILTYPTVPVENSAEFAYLFLVGDYFAIDDIGVQNSSTYTAGTVWEVAEITESSGTRVITWEKVDNGSKLITALNGYLNASVDLDNLPNTANGISWFNTIIAKKIIAESIFTESLTMGEKGVIKSYKYGELDSQGNTIGGYKLYFSEDGNIGVIKADKLIADKSSEFHGKVETDYFVTNDSIDTSYPINSFNSNNLTKYAKESEWLAQVAEYVYNNGSGDSGKSLSCTVNYHGTNCTSVFCTYSGSGIYVASVVSGMLSNNVLVISKSNTTEVYNTYINTFTHSSTTYSSNKQYWDVNTLYNALIGSTLAVGQSAKLSSYIQIDTQTYTTPIIRANNGSVSIINGGTEIAIIASSGKRNGSVYLPAQNALSDSTNGISVTNIVPLSKTSSTDTRSIGTGTNLFDYVYSKEIYTKITDNSSLETYRAGTGVIESYHSGTSWYRIWSDGWIEQGGISQSVSTPVDLITEFSNTNYAVLITGVTSSFATYCRAYNKTKTQFECGVIAQWYACGYGDIE